MATIGNRCSCQKAAWQDLSVRMPGQKHWKRAYLLRRDLQREQSPPSTLSAAPLSQAPQCLPASATSQHQRQQPAPPIPPPRDPTPGVGWTEPERRKFRFRFEDIAFD